MDAAAFAKRTPRRLADSAARLVSTLRGAPGTGVYLLIVLITTWVLSSVDERVADVLLRQVSTNLVRMAQDAPRSLILSAFVISGSNVVWLIVAFAIVHVPAERWLGTWRWLVVVAAAHVGASAITTIGIWFVERSGGGGATLAYPIDVGVSYGVAGAAGALLWRLPRPIAVAWCGLAVVGFGFWRVVASPTFTDFGHLSAFCIGVLVGYAVAPHVRHHPHAVVRRRYVAAGCLAVVCIALAALTVYASNSSPIITTASTVVVRGRVGSVQHQCTTGPCDRANVDYTIGNSTRTATVDVPSSAKTRDRLLLRVGSDPEVSPTVVPVTSSVDATGFFALATILTGVIAAGLLVNAVRKRAPAPILAA